MDEARLNRTEGFYRSDAPSLFWEMTICQCLARTDSLYQVALEKPAPYGALVARFLGDRLGSGPLGSVVEVGGGYGSLMAAFLGVAEVAEATLVDLSPRFLREQRRTLAGRENVRFVESDGAAFFRSLTRPVDLVISNENLGDFPTAVGLDREQVVRAASGGGGEGVVAKVGAKVARYGLDLTDAPSTFAFNLGAVEYLEALAKRARAVFLTEHSSDVVLPGRYDFLPLDRGDGFPRRVPLKDHDEYTIRFGDLETVARWLGFRVECFHLAELVGLRHDEGIRFMARAGIIGQENAEVVHEFCDHIAEYQGLLLLADS